MRWWGILLLTLYLTVEAVGMSQFSMPLLLSSIYVLMRAAAANNKCNCSK